jgi:pimeloyl-ACP methyl ester carboxylesterase
MHKNHYYKRQVLFIAFLIFFGCFNSLESQQISKQFSKTIKYLIYLPEDYGKDSTIKWPLILFLHGAEERGDDLTKVKTHGPPRLVENGRKFQFIVVSPQAPLREIWSPDILIWMLKDIIANYKVDENAVYLTGLSIGGTGTWETAQKFPGLFAAIAPVCGSGDPAQAWKMRHTNVWIFHGEKDPSVPVKNSVIMYDSLKQFGRVKLTVYPGVGHDSWTETYNKDELYKWFLDHKRFRYEETNMRDSLDYFTGLFSSGYDSISIFRVEDKLWIRYGFGGYRVSLLKKSSGNTFFLEDNGPDEILYNNNKEGLISSFTFFTDTRRTFFRLK